MQGILQPPPYAHSACNPLHCTHSVPCIPLHVHISLVPLHVHTDTLLPDILAPGEFEKKIKYETRNLQVAALPLFVQTETLHPNILAPPPMNKPKPYTLIFSLLPTCTNRNPTP